jgi:hypothetical protein
MLARGSAVFGASSTNTFAITRNSTADSGTMLINVGYTDAVTHLYTQGLYRGSGHGISELVVNNRDNRIANGDVSGWFDTWGTASDGTAWLESGPNPRYGAARTTARPATTGLWRNSAARLTLTQQVPGSRPGRPAKGFHAGIVQRTGRYATNVQIGDVSRGKRYIARGNA